MFRLRFSLVLVDKITIQYATAMRYYASIRSMLGILIALTLDGTSSRHVRVLFANRASRSRRYDNWNTRRLRSLREHGVTSCSSAGLRTTLQKRDKQRTYRHHDTKFRYKINRRATILHEVTKADAKTFPKILRVVVATRSDTNTAQKSTHNNIACPSHTKYDNNNYARLPDTEIGGLTDLLRSSYSGNPLVRLSVRSLSRALITSFGRFPRSPQHKYHSANRR